MKLCNYLSQENYLKCNERTPVTEEDKKIGSPNISRKVDRRSSSVSAIAIPNNSVIAS